ncbi:MAG: DUF2790 domain-containing protein [Pseudomonas sp.]|uniref:DUF2790 domain-containing protein n=1 Tax=Pseudomonas sp. TaxID=306 RepID=UPI00299E8C6A|nr:DUF2790 domain-containing protein [Pseudomonas sp.]MDX1725732.1 DUF2790 domain-containing protein [Pseudomonas sp.]
MKRLISFTLAATLGIAGTAWAQSSPSQEAEKVQAVDYHYGMSLDVQKVIHISDNSDKVGVVPTTIIFLDSNGKLHKVNYLELGSFDSSD